MLLSISSFSQTTSNEKWKKAILFGLVLGFFSIVLLENVLRFKGMDTSVKDSAGLWATQRAEATKLKKEDYIIVGASRTQLGLDSDLWSSLTGQRVVQLSIDAAPAHQILEDLAADEEIVAKIIVSANLADFKQDNRPVTSEWINTYHTGYKGLVWPKFEQKVKAKLESISVLYANLLPQSELFKLLFGYRQGGKIYLKTLENRDRRADYRLVAMPDFYLARVFRNLGVNVLDARYQKQHGLEIKTMEDLNQEVIRVATKKAEKMKFSLKSYDRFFDVISRLKENNDVMLLKMPTSGLVRVMEDLYYPKESWLKFIERADTKAIDYRDYPELQFDLVDGSHLDQSQKKAFTENLYRIFDGG